MQTCEVKDGLVGGPERKVVKVKWEVLQEEEKKREYEEKTREKFDLCFEEGTRCTVSPRWKGLVHAFPRFLPMMNCQTGLSTIRLTSAYMASVWKTYLPLVAPRRARKSNSAHIRIDEPDCAHDPEFASRYAGAPRQH